MKKPAKAPPQRATTEFDFLEVIGAKVHNLKDLSVRIPRNQLVVITGLSGSGKSSLAFDTIYAEGQRRYMETMSAYARQFMGQMERPDVEHISGLSPVISIEQKTTGRNPRSTVGTITEVYDFLRLLYARVGEAYSYDTGKKMVKYSEEEMLAQIAERFDDRKVALLAPLVRGRKGHYRELFEQVRKQGYTKVRVDGEIVELVSSLQVDRYKVHDIELVVDRLHVQAARRDRLIASLQTALRMGDGLVMITDNDTGETASFSRLLMDAETGLSYEEPSPNTFSFNSPYGQCPTCKGLGNVMEVDMAKVVPDDTKSIAAGGIVPFGEERDTYTFKQVKILAKHFKFKLTDEIRNIPKEGLDVLLWGGSTALKKEVAQELGQWYDFSFNVATEGICNAIKRWHAETGSEKMAQWAEDFLTTTACADCDGYRLRREARHFKLAEHHIGQLAEMNLIDLRAFVDSTLEPSLSSRQATIGKDVIKEIRLRLDFLLNVGLTYLTLNRPTGTLSGGEAQRIRLATQIGSALTGITYILDEPSIGLHQRDNQRLIASLRNLADIGNTVLVVEHDKDIMLASDYLIDLGPGAGKLGGELVAAGIPAEVVAQPTVTSDYLANRRQIEVPAIRRKGNGKTLKLAGATGNNLQNVGLELPLGSFICVTGVSGSGKSTLINETLYPILQHHFFKSLKRPMPHTGIEGLEHLDKVIEIDQSPIGRTPRSNPATYTNLFGDIRNLYAAVPESKIRGYKVGRFSFNVKGGRCETCQGSGRRVIEMNFLPDVEVECETCFGKRYNRETLEILYKGKSISDVLDMSIEEAVPFFEAMPSIYRKIKTLCDVGLGYVTLGQQATTLSGGEAQRVKLAEELSKRDTGNTMYILDEPTTGLHFEDIRLLLGVLNRLVEKGNTILVIEHNLDVIKVADHVIDLGPEGGKGGGKIIATGTPEQVANCKESFTGQFLRIELGLDAAV